MVQIHTYTLTRRWHADTSHDCCPRAAAVVVVVVVVGAHYAPLGPAAGYKPGPCSHVRCRLALIERWRTGVLSLGPRWQLAAVSVLLDPPLNEGHVRGDASRLPKPTSAGGQINLSDFSLSRTCYGGPPASAKGSPQWSQRSVERVK